MQTIPIRVSENGGSVPMSVAVNSAVLPVGVEQVRVVYEERPEYRGDYDVIPSGVEQILHTDGKRMVGDVTVAAIPQNYGLITWNGAFLTIS